MRFSDAPCPLTRRRLACKPSTGEIRAAGAKHSPACG